MIQTVRGEIEFLDIGVGEFYLNTGVGAPQRLFVDPDDFDSFKSFAERKTLAEIEVKELPGDCIPPGLMALPLAPSDR